LEVLKPIQQKLTIPNPEYVEAEKMGHYTSVIPKTLKLYENIENGLICHKGALPLLYQTLLEYPFENISIHDNRRILNPLNISFQGELGLLQQKVADSISKQPIGVWEPPTSINRKIVALYLIAQRKQPALIVVTSRHLRDQWVECIENYLGIKAADVGIIAEGRVRMGEKITIGLVQSVLKRAADVTPHIGHLILDAFSSKVTGGKFLATVEQFDCKYQLWLNASRYWHRHYDLDEVIKNYVGPNVGQVDEKYMLKYDNLCQGEAFFIPTEFTPEADPSVNYIRVLTEMTQNMERNLVIVKTTLKYRYGLTLILSDRQQHCEAIGSLLKKYSYENNVAIVTGDTPAEQKQQIIKAFNKVFWERPRFLVTTDQMIYNKLDLPAIGTLVITTPVKFSNNIFQNKMQALRPYLRKNRTVVLNFVDDHGVFQSSARSSWEKYKQLGFSVLGRIEKNT
jgi:superfamily II DNA or RNA helicase